MTTDKFIVKINESTYEYSSKVLLSDIIRNAGYDFSAPCSGKGICGKCAVKASGKLSEKLEKEAFLPNGYRLACTTYAVGDCEIRTDGNQMESVSLSVLPEMTEKRIIAIDIGTTTLAAVYIDGGKIADERLVPNPQRAYGADVISRLENSILHGAEMRRSVEDAVSTICSGWKADETVIVGNTAMLYIYFGIPCDGLIKAPFYADEKFGRYIRDGLYVPPCIGPFFGADAVCGLYTAKLLNTENPFIFADIGTNGEIAASCKSGFLCTSAAAGSAFEMLSQCLLYKSVINRVYIENSQICYDCKEKTPKGISASALIDTIDVMKKAGITDSSGRLNEADDSVFQNRFEIGNSGIFISSDDIRAIQKEKAAIRTAIDLLIQKSKEKYGKIYLAGGFGQNTNATSAFCIGLLPKVESVIGLGNSALSGAVLSASDRHKSEISKLVALCKTIQLTDEPDFEKLYIENMKI